MGAWGTSLFADDTACDVRDEYRELIGEGCSSTEATTTLVHSYNEEISDPETGPVFWLALAATQWKLGRLEENVKAQAIQIIDSGDDLQRWADTPKLAQKRADVLAKLKEQLCTPQPKPKRVAAPFRDRCDWKRGEVFSYERKSGKFILFRVVGLFRGDGTWTEAGTLTPVIEILDWQGTRIPSPSRLEKLRVRSDTSGHTRAVLFRMSDRDTKLKRFQRLAITLEPSQLLGTPEHVNQTCGSLYARSLDSELGTFYGL